MTDHYSPRGYALQLITYLSDDADIAGHVNRNWGTSWKPSFITELRRTARKNAKRGPRIRKSPDDAICAPIPLVPDSAPAKGSARLLAALWKHHADYISARGAVRG